MVVYMQHIDLLQLMIDASDSETHEGLEKGEIVADSVGFMLAGYETTSTTLTFATYALAANTEVQERLANEIHEYFEENPVSDMLVCIHLYCTFGVYVLHYQGMNMYDCTVCFTHTGQVHVRCLT